MLTNILIRLAFVLLLTASQSIDAFGFSPVWLVPPVTAMLLNLRIAWSMRYRTWRDVVFAAAALPTESYVWLRAGHFLRTWTKFLSRERPDSWAAQTRAERGSGNSHLVPLVVVLVSFVVLGWTLFQLRTVIRTFLLWHGWPVLYVVTIAQTVVMASKLLRRQRGYRV